VIGWTKATMGLAEGYSWPICVIYKPKSSDKVQLIFQSRFVIAYNWYNWPCSYTLLQLYMAIAAQPVIWRMFVDLLLIPFKKSSSIYVWRLSHIFWTAFVQLNASLALRWRMLIIFAELRKKKLRHHRVEILCRVGTSVEFISRLS
jgi:hypothetical protein